MSIAEHDGLEVLTEHECFQKLRAGRLGRVVVSVGALPAIMPVHYTLLDRDPIFRTDEGAKLMAASAGQVVCLEIDDFDPERHTGWSVMVTGTASVVNAPEELARARQLPLQPWVGRGEAYVRIEATIVSGRRIAARHYGASLHDGPPDDH